MKLYYANELNDENARPLPNIHDFEGATLREKAIAMARAMNKGAGDEADDPEARPARDLAEGAAVDDQIASQRHSLLYFRKNTHRSCG